MPLFTYPPQPFLLVDATALSGGTGATTAGAAFCVAQVLYAPTTFSQMRVFMGAAPTGNIDMGIYDALGGNAAPGSLLAHTGAIASTAGVFTKSLLANITLSPGQYWLAFLDTVADLIEFRNTSGAGLGAFARSNSTALTVLPASLGSANVATTATAMAVEALVLNGFS